MSSAQAHREITSRVVAESLRGAASASTAQEAHTMTDGERPLAYIVILNWNGWRDTVECLASLRALTYPRYHTVVVDNASTDDSEARVRGAAPEVTILQAGANLGYAGGNNLGIRHALACGAEYVWLLNNDTTVATDALGELVDAARGWESNQELIGVVGSKIYYAREPNRLWWAGGRVDWRRGIANHVGINEDDHGQYDALTESETANGASMLIARETFERIGLFDERYFLYFEEADLSCRARNAGLQIRFAPRSHVWHSVSSSTGVRSSRFLYHFTRSNILFVRTHRRTTGLLVAAPYLLKRSILNLPAHEGQRALDRARLGVWLRAWIDGLVGRYGPGGTAA